MLQCQRCGARISEGAAFCPKCGSRAAECVAEVCEYCGSPIRGGSRSCEACGAPVPVVFAPAEPAREEKERTETVKTVYVEVPVAQPMTSDKNRWVALLLAFFLGGCGAHRFYVGKIGTGILWLLTGGFGGIGWFVDCLSILCGWFSDKEGRRLK